MPQVISCSPKLHVAYQLYCFKLASLIRMENQALTSQSRARDPFVLGIRTFHFIYHFVEVKTFVLPHFLVTPRPAFNNRNVGVYVQVSKGTH